ncbi:flavin reductase [Limnohabitans sp. 2KL-1]|jgi:flavin reductase (DIM6/NTAB) family NADH-FMN oxidoreductase RutF|uniref:flavin reductase family protein n=1 Tax=Limnohabitans sp. 2KL-1 TaxID=1100699 RepID=UPI000D39BC00|nr:flavin reductase family protein [Limnohabitans sp. 2KL-1]PUE48005.1 flavin reductase [Limnohabitans sp. 2KL-1]
MQVHLTNAGAVTLCHPTVFNKLDVLVDPQSPERLELAIARIGRREGTDHVRLAPSILRFLSGHAGEAEWESGFSAMLDYATQKGWVNAQGEIRAHLSFTDNDRVVSVDDFKAAMRALPAGIAAVTTAREGAVAGMIVSSLTSISADPPMIGFFAHQNSSIHPALIQSGHFVANVLGEDHRGVMSSFLNEPQGRARFNTGQWTPNEKNAPVLQDALASLECDIVCTQTLGTHQLIVGKIRKSTCSSANPVVHFNAGTHKLAPEWAH